MNEAQGIETEVAEDEDLSISNMCDLMVKLGGVHKLRCTREEIKRHLWTTRERNGRGRDLDVGTLDDRLPTT